MTEGWSTIPTFSDCIGWKLLIHQDGWLSKANNPQNPGRVFLDQFGNSYKFGMMEKSRSFKPWKRWEIENMSDFGVLDQQHSNNEDGYESFYWVDEPYN